MDGQAYHVWSTLVKMRLQSKGVSYVLEQDPPPETERAYTTWKQHDSLVFTVLTEALPTKEQSRFIHLSKHDDAARRVWKGISELYFRTSQYDYMKLQDELRRFKPTPGENMVEYLARADELHRKFTTYDVPISEAEFSGQVFRSLGTIHNSWIMLHEKLPEKPEQWTLSLIHNLLQKEDNRRRSMIQKDVVPMFPPLGYRPRASANLTFDLDEEQTRLSPIKTKGAPGSTPHHPDGTRSPRTPSSGKTTPCRSTTPSRSTPVSPHKPPQSPRRPQSPGRGLSTKHNLTCWKCFEHGHAYYEAAKCSKYEEGWTPAPRAGAEGGTRRGSSTAHSK
jgi:hypothetical protein